MNHEKHATSLGCQLSTDYVQDLNPETVQSKIRQVYNDPSLRQFLQKFNKSSEAQPAKNALIVNKPEHVTKLEGLMKNFYRKQKDVKERHNHLKMEKVKADRMIINRMSKPRLTTKNFQTIEKNDKPTISR